jgi:hypothetical protein
MYVDALLALFGSILGNIVTGVNAFASGATVVSPNAIDLASGGSPTGQVRDLGEGSAFDIARVEVTTSFAGGTSVQFVMVSSDDAAGVTNPTIIGASGVIPTATLVAGYRTAFQINPRLASKGQRYLTMQAINLGVMTAGAIYGDLGAEIQDGQKFYPSGFALL